jgi:hypothetical protein
MNNWAQNCTYSALVFSPKTVDHAWGWELTAMIFGVITQRAVAIPYQHFGKPVSRIFKGEESLTLEEGTDKLSRDIGKELPLLAV